MPRHQARAWHHHMALAGPEPLFVMGERLPNPMEYPPLSAADAVELPDWAPAVRPAGEQRHQRIRRRRGRRSANGKNASLRQRKARTPAPDSELSESLQ